MAEYFYTIPFDAHDKLHSRKDGKKQFDRYCFLQRNATLCDKIIKIRGADVMQPAFSVYFSHKQLAVEWDCTEKEARGTLNLFIKMGLITAQPVGANALTGQFLILQGRGTGRGAGRNEITENSGFQGAQGRGTGRGNGRINNKEYKENKRENTKRKNTFHNFNQRGDTDLMAMINEELRAQSAKERAQDE